MEHDWNKDRDKIIGLGEHSLRKSYYPQLQEKIDKLEAVQHNLVTLVNSISDAIIIHDKEGNIILLNERARKVYNIDAVDQAEYTVFDLTSCRQNTENLRSIWADVLNNNTQMFEWLGKQLNTNTDLPLYVSLSPTIWNNEHVIVAVIRDFSERKEYEQALVIAKERAEKSEQELEKHKRHLEELVQERTQELEAKNAELERFNNLFVGREFRIKELRERVKKLEALLAKDTKS